MFCNKCGSKLSEGEKFCGECGTLIVAQAQPVQTAQTQNPSAQPVQVQPVQVQNTSVQPQAQAQPVQTAQTQNTSAQPQPQAQPVQPVQVQNTSVQAQPQMQAQSYIDQAQTQQYQGQPQMQGQSLMQPTATPAGEALVKKKKKPWIVFVVIGAVVIVLAGLVAGMIAFGAVDKINSRMKTSTAAKYYANMDYENAIAYYNEAIEIDPENVEAYLGLAEAYLALDDIGHAIASLEAGLEATGSEEIAERLEELYIMDRKIFGYVYKVDTDTDPTDNEPLAGTTIDVEYPNGKHKTYTTDDKGYYETENELEAGTYKINFYYNDDYMTYEDTIKAEKSSEQLDVYLEPATYSYMSGTVLVGDEDTDYTNNEPLVGATVTIEKINSSNKQNATTQTDDDGRYDFDGLLMGVYKITIHMDEFIDVTQNVVIYEGQAEVYNSLVELIPSKYSEEGYAEGMIYDAVTGYGVEGITIKIRSGINNTDGEILATVTTDENGHYITPGMKSGNYCLEVVDERETDSEPYINTSINVKILGGITISNQDATVSGTLVSGQIRIVLTWGSNPADLDSHLLISSEEGYSPGHVDFMDTEYYLYDYGTVVDLDLDDTDCYGPETTTIYQYLPGVYTFFVHNYSENGSSGLSNSGATVQVYTEGAVAPTYVFYVPAGYGYIWNVFSYDSVTGVITPINTIDMDYEYYYDYSENIWVHE